MKVKKRGVDLIKERIEWLIQEYAKCPPIAEVFELQGKYYLYDVGVSKLFQCSRDQYLIIEYIIQGEVRHIDTLQKYYENEAAFEEALKDIIALIQKEGFFRIKKIG